MTRHNYFVDFVENFVMLPSSFDVLDCGVFVEIRVRHVLACDAFGENRFWPLMCCTYEYVTYVTYEKKIILVCQI